MVRLVQRSTVKFVINAFVGIGIGALFAWRAARGGGDEGDQALAFFLPGLLYNAVYGAAVDLHHRHPVAHRRLRGGKRGRGPDGVARRPQGGRLCSRLTWLLALPCVIRVAVQGPIYLAGTNGWWDKDSAVAALGVAKLAMGWPLQVAALAAMVWLLARNATPIEPGEPEPDLGHA